jgi:hypothetical protein
VSVSDALLLRVQDIPSSLNVSRISSRNRRGGCYRFEDSEMCRACSTNVELRNTYIILVGIRLKETGYYDGSRGLLGSDTV